MLVILGVVVLFVSLDIVGLNPFTERGSIVGEGIGARGGCAGYEDSVSLSPQAVLTSEANLYVLESAIWDSPTIPVCWENPTEDDDRERTWVEEHMERTWAKHSGLVFTGWDACTDDSSGIRIVIEDANPHVLHLGRALDGVENGMSLNFTFGNWSTSCQWMKKPCIKSVAAHEFGHALGFAHEQNRADSQCDGREQGGDGDRVIGPWDLNSVMNYCNPAWNGNGNLSAVDIQGVQQVYGKSASALQEVFDVCATEKNQGWQDTCSSKLTSNPEFSGTCACKGNLVKHNSSGDILCDSGTPNCSGLPYLGSSSNYQPLPQKYRDLYTNCDTLRAQSKWTGSCDHPVVNDTRMFEGACECAGDIYRHKVTGLFLCDQLPSTCGDMTTVAVLSDYEFVAPQLYTNAELESLYNHCNELRRTKGDFFPWAASSLT